MRIANAIYSFQALHDKWNGTVNRFNSTAIIGKANETNGEKKGTPTYEQTHGRMDGWMGGRGRQKKGVHRTNTCTLCAHWKTTKEYESVRLRRYGN